MHKKIFLSEILTDFLLIPSSLDREVTGLTQNSQQIMPGEVFFACLAENKQKDQFIAEAISRGAVAIVSEKKIESTAPLFVVENLREKLGFIAARFYEHPSQQMKVIGVTGTNGKTSCTHFIAQALDELNTPCGVIGTIGIGMGECWQEATHTTPDPMTLQKLLANFCTQGAKAVTMEVSSHGLVQGRVQGTEFYSGIFTNLTRDHLDYHGTFEAYGQAKRQLFEQPNLRNAIINLEDPFGKSLAGIYKDKLNIIGYSTNKNDAREFSNLPVIFASNATFDTKGFTARIHSPWAKGELRSHLLGQFNLSNVLACLAALLQMGVPFEIALSRMSALQGVPGRMEVLGGGAFPRVIIDYSHTPDALEKALTAARTHCEGQLWCVFGCGGERDPGKRPMMGEVAARYADVAIVTDDNPRSENPEKITDAILQGMPNREAVKVEHDRKRAIHFAITHAKKNDIILVAGKGHETYQQIGQEKNPFNDADVVRSILFDRAART